MPWRRAILLSAALGSMPQMVQSCRLISRRPDGSAAAHRLNGPSIQALLNLKASSSISRNLTSATLALSPTPLTANSARALRRRLRSASLRLLVSIWTLSESTHIAANENLDPAERQYRIDHFHRPYHAALERWLAAAEPALILSLHSFTPRLETSDAARPWQVGVLYNQDDRAARIADLEISEIVQLSERPQP